MAAKLTTASYVIMAIVLILVAAFAVMLPQRISVDDELATEKVVRFGLTSSDGEQFDRHPVDEAFVVERVLSASFPSGLSFAPDGRMFFTELSTGKIFTMIENQTEEFASVPDIYLPPIDEAEGGLLDIELDPDFVSNGFVYVYYTGDGENKIGRFTDIAVEGTDFTVIFDGVPQGRIHNGGKLKFAHDGKLYLSTGDSKVSGEFLGADNPTQDINSKAGKILRINTDGSNPSDNPFLDSYTYALGIRNVYGYDINPETGKFYAADNGVDCCDELNIIELGKNYGWPFEMGINTNSSYAQPIYAWSAEDRVAPTRLAFYNATDLYMGTWRTREIYRFVIENDSVFDVDAFVLEDLTDVPITGYHAGELHPGADPRGGVLDIELGIDGLLYFTDADGIYRLRFRSAEGEI